MKILVLGAGATGGYFGGRLAQSGADVTFLVRQRRYAQLLQRGLTIESPFGNVSLQVAAKLQSELKPEYDVILVTCKAYALPSAIESIEPLMSAGRAAVLPILNGYAHIEQLNQQYGAYRVIPGTARIQVTMTPDGVVRQLNEWQTITFGEQERREPSERTLQLQALFKAAGIECRISPNIDRDLWAKLVHLATVAGMTCLMRANVGEIVRTPEGSALLNSFFETNVQVATRLGYELDESFIASYRDLFRQRDAKYEASMLRDLESGGSVEGDHILGFMLNKCREVGLSDALHLAAYSHVKAYEQRRDADRLPRGTTP